jgi:hypothetical protein
MTRDSIHEGWTLYTGQSDDGTWWWSLLVGGIEVCSGSGLPTSADAESKGGEAASTYCGRRRRLAPPPIGKDPDASE